MQDILDGLQVPEGWIFAIDEGDVHVAMHLRQQRITADEARALSKAFDRLAEYAVSRPPIRRVDSRQVCVVHNWLLSKTNLPTFLFAEDHPVITWLVPSEQAANLRLGELSRLILISLDRQVPALAEASTEPHDRLKRDTIYKQIANADYLQLERASAEDYQRAGLTPPEGL
jgi:hypothetical protein